MLKMEEFIFLVENNLLKSTETTDNENSNRFFKKGQSSYDLFIDKTFRCCSLPLLMNASNSLI